MDVYALHPGGEAKKLDKTEFENETSRQPPYYQPDSQDRENGSQFAVCPACDNPIQTLGFYKKVLTEEGKPEDRVYARHVARSIPKLAEYRQEAYEVCPLAGPKKWSKSARRKGMDEQGREILRLLRDNFDFVTQIVTKFSGIRMTPNLARSMLKTYLGMQGYLYYGATRLNVPWVFAYMANAQSLFGRVLLPDSDIKKALTKAKVPGMILKGDQIMSNGQFCNLSVCYIGHQSTVKDGMPVESMRIKVSWRDTEDGLVFHDVWEKKLIIDPLDFQKAVKFWKQRNPAMLEIAREELEGLIE